MFNEAQSAVGKGHGKCTHDNIGVNALKIKPLSVRKEYRSGSRQIGQALSDLCLPLAKVYVTAVGKEEWWHADFLSLLEVRAAFGTI